MNNDENDDDGDEVISDLNDNDQMVVLIRFDHCDEKDNGK